MGVYVNGFICGTALFMGERGSPMASVDEEIRLLTEAGHLTEEEVRREAFHALLRERPELRLLLAIERYKKEEITLNRGAKIAGMTLEEFKRALHKRGERIRRGTVSEDRREDIARDLGRGS